MRALIYTEYGPPEVLRFTETARPVPKDDEVLIRIRAASVNPLDWHFMRGKPFFVRLMIGGLLKPKDTRLGVDVAGLVEAVGGNVTQFKAGDEVFGACRGAFAEYVCAPEAKLTLKPADLSFEGAAAVPVAAITALQALRFRLPARAEPERNLCRIRRRGTKPPRHVDRPAVAILPVTGWEQEDVWLHGEAEQEGSGFSRGPSGSRNDRTRHRQAIPIQRRG